MTIIPNNNRVTFESTPASAFKNASSRVVALSRNISAVPPSAAITRRIHAVATSTYVSTKITMAATITNPLESSPFRPQRAEAADAP